MLSFHFMQGISEVFANEPELSRLIREEQIRVTHAEVGQHFNILNIFWTTDNLERISFIAQKLHDMVGLVTKKMVEKNFMTLMPTIRFVHDKSKASIEAVNEALTKSGLKPSFDPRNFAPPTELATGYHFLDPLGPRIRAKKVALFYEEFKESQEREYRDKGVNYRTDKFTAPPDMRLDAQGLDYERIMNLVMANVQRSRADAKRRVYVADPLPPAVWVDEHQQPPDHEKARLEKPDTTVRLSTMRQFVIEHRRKRAKFFKEKERAKNEELDGVADDHLYVMDRLYGGGDEESAQMRADEEDFMDEDEYYDVGSDSSQITDANDGDTQMISENSRHE